MPAAANSDRFVQRFGRNRVVGIGLTLVGIAMVIFTTVQIDTLLPSLGLDVLPSWVWFRAHNGSIHRHGHASNSPRTKQALAVRQMTPAEKLGGALGIAIGGSVLNEFYQRSFVLPEGLELAALPVDPSTSFPAAIQLGRGMDGPIGDQLVLIAQTAFVDGMVASAAVFAVIAFTTAIIAFRFIPTAPNGESDEE